MAWLRRHLNFERRPSRGHHLGGPSAERLAAEQFLRLSVAQGGRSVADGVAPQ